MSTTAKASDHVKPCNIEQSERHNRRDADYIASLNPRTLYVRTEGKAEDRASHAGEEGNCHWQER